MVVVLAVASLCLAEPEADPLHYYAPYAYPYFYRPYYASGYAGPLPGHSYQSVHRLHKREAEADPQLLLNAGLPFSSAPLAVAAPAPLVAAAPAPIALPVAHPVVNSPVVKSVVETPAVVTHAVHATPLVHHVAPVVPHIAPVVHHAPALVHHEHKVTPFVNLGRKRREAEAEAEADPYYYSSVAGHGQAYSTFVDDHPVVAYSHPFGYNYGLPYTYAPAPVVKAAPVVEAAPVVKAAPVVEAAPVADNTVPVPIFHHAAAPLLHGAAPVVQAAAPVVHAAAPLVHAATPVVETVSKPVTYTHLGAHPIQPTTVVQTESRLVGR